MYNTNYQIPVMSRKDQALRNFFSQPKVLALSILGFVATFFNGFSGLIAKTSIDLSAFAELGIDTSAIEPYLNTNTSISFDIFSILSSVAFLLFYLNAKNPRKTFKAPATILNVIAIIRFVLVCILAITIIIGLIILFALGFGNGNSDDIGAIAIFLVIILFLAVIILALAFIIAYVEMRFTKSLKTSTTTELTSMKGIKGFGVVLIINCVSAGLTLMTSFVPTSLGSNFVSVIFTVFTSAISLAYYILFYQFVSDFGKIIEAEEATRRFETAPYNQVPYSQVPVTGEVYDNRRPFYNNLYTTPQATEVETVQPNLCKNCGAAVNDDDYFCMKCGTRIERD